jgi:hypothetical protein
LKGVEDEDGQESAGKDLKAMAMKDVEDEEITGYSLATVF